MSCASPASRSALRCRSTAASRRRSRCRSSRRPEDQFFLARHDSDPFSRWQAFNTLLTDALIAGFRQCLGGKRAGIPGRARRACRRHRRRRDAGARLPRAGAGAAGRGRHRPRDRHEHRSRRHLRRARGAGDGDRRGQRERCSRELYDALGGDRAVQPRRGERRPPGAAQRAARLSRASCPAAPSSRPRHFAAATNMTDRAAALTVLAHRHAGVAEATRGARGLRGALPRRSAGHGQMVPDPGDGAGRRRRVDTVSALTRPPGLLDGQPEPRALADRHLRRPPTRPASTAPTAPATASSPTPC